MMKNIHFLDNLDRQITNKHLLTHTFYMAWTRGELSLECLKDYAMQYYHHVKAFPRYLSALHSHTDDSFTRRMLLQNLMEEEAGNPNHPDMWRAFAKRLGATDEELDQHVANDEIKALIHTFEEICRKGTVADGLAALYSYESQIPSVSESKIDGLKNYYNMKSPKDWVYFTVHIEADKEHAAVERDLLSKHVTNENSAQAMESSQKVLDCLWNFLSSLAVKYNIACPV